jgi:hypothetical protein
LSLFTPGVLKWILERKPNAEWGAARFAREPEKYKRKIDQINALWDALPADYQKKLKPNLLSTTERSFRGAFSELVAYRVLRCWYSEIQFDPLIGTNTPDFHVTAPENKRAFISEVFSLGPHEWDKAYYWGCARLRKALKGFTSPYHLAFKISAATGTGLDWLPDKLKTYLDAHIEDQDTEKVHVIEHEGKYVFFEIGPRAENGQGFINYRSQVMSGNPQVKNLTDRLEQKAEKYKFPFLAICVTDSIGTADRHTLMEAMLGRIHIKVPVNLENPGAASQETSWGFDDNGFWGVKNTKFADHLGVQGLLFIEPQYETDTSFALNVSLVENPHIHSSLCADMPKVPDLLKHLREQGTYEVAGFKLKP